MTVEYLHSEIRISEIIGGYLVSRLYIGYTKKEAVRMFKKGE